MGFKSYGGKVTHNWLMSNPLMLALYIKMQFQKLYHHYNKSCPDTKIIFFFPNYIYNYLVITVIK
jgi:hypothetical protein